MSCCCLLRLYRCAVALENGQECGCKVTLYQKSSKHAESTSNAFKHFRARAEKGCKVHECCLLA